jgi:hypothetical protein
MKSHVLTKDQQDLIKLSKAMTPQERLIAFLNHSRLGHRLYREGKQHRLKPQGSGSNPKITSEQ